MIRLSATVSAVAFVLGLLPVSAARAETAPGASSQGKVIILAQAGRSGGGRSVGGGGRSFGGGGRSVGGGGPNFGGGRSFGGPGYSNRGFSPRSGTSYRGRSDVRSSPSYRSRSSTVRSRSTRTHGARTTTGPRGTRTTTRATASFARTAAQRRADAVARSNLRRHAIVNPAFRPHAHRPPGTWPYRGGWWHDRWRHRWYPYVVVGWVGPWFWPYAYYDFFDFFFFSYAYDDFWPYAYDDVYVGIYGPYAYVDSAPAVAARGTGSSGRPARQRQPVDVCKAETAQLVALPVERIAKTVEPTPEQQKLLDALKEANAKAIQILRDACPSDLPATPPGRLAAAAKRLKAMREAVLVIGPAMDAFYNSLNDEQKARFNAVAAPEDEEAVSRDKGDLTKLCGKKEPDVVGVPMASIEKTVRPTDAQKAAFDAFKDASEKAAGVLTADCPTYKALTPTGRIEAMEQRLDAMIKALDTVSPALTTFYDGLSDEQKARFNDLSPPRS